MSFPVRLAACTATLLVVLPGCRVSPAQGPEIILPVSWRNAAGFPTAAPERDLSSWWSSFGDPQMTRLIREALAGNRDLASAVARVRQAQAQRDAQCASLFPSVNYDGSRSAGKTWNDGSADRSSTSYSAGLSASWEI
ncbi:MAG TPA: TolC family protein, partial [Haloferula sp.]